MLNHQLLWMHLTFNLLFLLFHIIFPLLVPHECINFYIHFHSWPFCLPFSALLLIIIWKHLLHHAIPVLCLTILGHQWFLIYCVLFLLSCALWLFSYLSYNHYLNVLWIFFATVLLHFMYFPYCFMILYCIGSVSSFLSLNQYLHAPFASLFIYVILSCHNNISLYLSLDDTAPHVSCLPWSNLYCLKITQ